MGDTPRDSADSIVGSPFSRLLSDEGRIADRSADTGFNYCGQSMSKSMRIPAGNQFIVDGIKIDVVMRMANPEIVVFDGVLTPIECDRLVALAQDKLSPSRTISTISGGPSISDDRTSSSAKLGDLHDPWLRAIQKRLADTVLWPVNLIEEMQVIHYNIGEQYKAHFDYFDETRPCNIKRVQNEGQRVGTVIIYLNTVAEGGETYFPRLGLTIVARCGTAVYFSNTTTDGACDPLTLHGGAPVRQGEKWIATQWLRSFACTMP